MNHRNKKNLKSGFTTGACAAAAAKAAALFLLSGQKPQEVEIPFPTGDRHSFVLHRCFRQDNWAAASIIKDAGDDPDVTNGAEIIALIDDAGKSRTKGIVLLGGPGVGRVTKPGLAVEVGEPAINPVPRRMISEAVREAEKEAGSFQGLRVMISVRDGEQLAEKTLNSRLGILGGLSILGTTGIVRPVSAKAWTDTIDASMSVARAAGLTEVIVSTGRTSEAAVQKLLQFPEEAQVMMGDYLAYALNSAKEHGFEQIHLSGMWAKILKCALEIPQTHVRHGALEVRHAIDLLIKLGLDPEIADNLRSANTAREIFYRLVTMGKEDVVRAVCLQAKVFAMRQSRLPVEVYLVTSEDGVVVHV